MTELDLLISKILNMPADREIDALVAENVMGWSRDKNYWKEVDGFRHSVDSDYDNPGWYPSTDIAAAWEVHKMAISWGFNKRRVYLDYLQYCVSKRVASEETTISWPDVLVLIEPIDFCRAALLTVREDKIAGGFQKMPEC
ncbi:MAG: hypothetical protein ABSG01_08990 [Anaerolineales bacterium]|jgi:hypothetical protein